MQIKKEYKIIDATIGAYDKTDISELIQAFPLHQLSQIFDKKDNDLYRDGGMAVFKSISELY